MRRAIRRLSSTPVKAKSGFEGTRVLSRMGRLMKKAITGKDQDFGRKFVADRRRYFLLSATEQVSESEVARAALEAYDGDATEFQQSLRTWVRLAQTERFMLELAINKSLPLKSRENAARYLRASNGKARKLIGSLCAESAIRGDANFFRELAEAVSVAVREDEVNSNQAHVLHAYQKVKRTQKRLPTVREVSDCVKKLYPTHERQDERTVRFVCKELGLRCAAGKRGRPKRKFGSVS